MTASLSFSPGDFSTLMNLQDICTTLALKFLFFYLIRAC